MALEQELVAALYEQRRIEYQILKYEPQSSAPQELKDSLCAARVHFNNIERQIRLARFGF